jgi:uncharacterized protein YegP (UPF0339 family)
MFVTLTVNVHPPVPFLIYTQNPIEDNFRFNFKKNNSTVRGNTNGYKPA